MKDKDDLREEFNTDINFRSDLAKKAAAISSKENLDALWKQAFALRERTDQLIRAAGFDVPGARWNKN